MSMSGVPYVHSDAGGFAGGEGDNELYVRWLQFAAFTPIFRPHGTALYEKDPNAFSFPSEAALIDEPYRSYAKEVIALRYAMLPYNYSLAYEQTKYGKPLMAPLYYYFSNDSIALKVQDEYMWGENLLVVPVLEKGSRIKTYYLPAGKWYNPANKKTFAGNAWYTDSISLETIVAFIKQGGFVATGKPGKNAGTTNGENLAVLYNPSTLSSSYELYFDDGETKRAIEKKAYELIKINSSGIKNNHLTLTIQSNNGNFANKPLKREMSFIIPNLEGGPKRILINAQTVKKEPGGMFELGASSWIDTNEETIVTVHLKGKPVSIELFW
jgi:oligosaccharide 4-alpha-D-glucosyltransferase